MKLSSIYKTLEMSKWADRVGRELIKSVSISVGGDSKPYWCCTKCGTRKSTRRPLDDTVCGFKYKRFNQTKYEIHVKITFPFLNDPIIQKQIETAFKAERRCDFDEFRKYLNSKIIEDNFIFSEAKNLTTQELIDKLDKFEARIQEQSYESMTEPETYTLDEVIYYLIGNDPDIYDHIICDNTVYIQQLYTGMIVDQHNDDWLRMWQELNRH